MAQMNDRALFSLFEGLIKSTNLVEYYPYNHPVDFLVGDIVQCSYMRGFFKILEVTNSYLSLEGIIDTPAFKDTKLHVGPEFLKKVQLNQQVMKVLFNEKD